MDIRIFLLVVVSAIVAYVQGSDACSAKFPVNTGHYCFKYIREKMTYDKATTRCNQMGAVVAHPAAQDWETWKQDVRAVTRNEHSLWVGSTRNISSWYWLNIRYDGEPIPIDYNLRKQGDISIPSSAWSSRASIECKQKVVNGTIVNGTMVNDTLLNSTSTDCDNDTANCAVFGTNGLLRDRDCGHEAHYVLCQGPIDYSSSCKGDHNCTENAYNLPISFTLCGCKCKSDYTGDGYNDCHKDEIHGTWVIIFSVIGGLLMFLHCVLGVRKQRERKASYKDIDAVRKTWSTHAIGFLIGLLIVLWANDII